MKCITKCLAIASLVVMSATASAGPWYFDVGAGNADVEDDSDLYMKLGVGYQYSRAISFEGGYLDLGEPNNVGIDGFYGGAKGKIEMNKTTNLYGKVGLYLWDAGVADGNDLLLGGGVEFERVGPGNLGVEVLTVDLDDADATLIGVSYNISLK